MGIICQHDAHVARRSKWLKAAAKGRRLQIIAARPTYL
jgi:hypothetical protein